MKWALFVVLGWHFCAHNCTVGPVEFHGRPMTHLTENACREVQSLVNWRIFQLYTIEPGTWIGTQAKCEPWRAD